MYKSVCILVVFSVYLPSVIPTDVILTNRWPCCLCIWQEPFEQMQCV